MARLFIMSVAALALSAAQFAVAATSATTTTVGETQAASGGAAGNVEQRLKRIERMLDNQVMLEMLQRVESLQQEVRELRNEIESQGFELQSMRKRQRDLYLDSDRRLRDLELGGGAQNAASSTSGDISDSGSAATGISVLEPSTSTPSVSTSTSSSGTTSDAQSVSAEQPADPVQEKAAYTKAFNYLKEGRYENAIKAFSQFLLDYPGGNYADNAQYWLGEANYVSRFFDEAIRQFSVVLAKYPASPKSSDARLKIGYAYYELENWEAASSTLSALAADFPGTSVARLANKRLTKMREEGH